jgi:uncharacterized protein YidB (DUF937 family)
MSAHAAFQNSGEDNAQVLQQLAGVTPEEVEQLTASGVLSIRLPKK